MAAAGMLTASVVGTFPFDLLVAVDAIEASSDACGIAPPSTAFFCLQETFPSCRVSRKFSEGDRAPPSFILPYHVRTLPLIDGRRSYLASARFSARFAFASDGIFLQEQDVSFLATPLRAQRVRNSSRGTEGTFCPSPWPSLWPTGCLVCPSCQVKPPCP